MLMFVRSKIDSSAVHTVSSKLPAKLLIFIGFPLANKLLFSDFHSKGWLFRESFIKPYAIIDQYTFENSIGELQKGTPL